PSARQLGRGARPAARCRAKTPAGSFFRLAFLTQSFSLSTALRKPSCPPKRLVYPRMSRTPPGGIVNVDEERPVSGTRSELASRALAVVMAGGSGTRLAALTRW